MKNKPPSAVAPVEPTDEVIREYARHLHEQSGRMPGRDLDNWLEAKACLMAPIPAHRSHARLQHQLARKTPHLTSDQAFTVPNLEAKNLAS